MASDELTESQRKLLLRWFDGELEPAETARAEELVANFERASDFVDALEQLRAATRTAFETAQPPDDRMPPAHRLAETAFEAPPLADLALDDLAPLLERFHDGEVTDPERRAVERLADRRQEVATYLDHLQLLGEATRTAEEVAAEQSDLTTLKASIERSLAYADHPDDPPTYDPARDHELLHRYADDELPPSQRRLVEAWLDEESGAASRTLEAIEQVGSATEAAQQQAGDGVDFDSLHSDIQGRIEALDADSEEKPADVVSLDASRTDGGRATATDGKDEGSPSTSDRFARWFSGYRQGVIGAAAAALLAVGAGLLFAPNLFENERVVVKEKTVVIVDSVQYSDGSSVVVDSPMQKVRAQRDRASNSKDDSDKPTVIWLLDDAKNDKSSNGTDESPSETPSSDPGNSPDAGGSGEPQQPDSSPPRGQPI